MGAAGGVGGLGGRRALAPFGSREQEVVDVAADGLVRLVAEQPGRGRVPGRYPLVAIHRDDGDRADLDERFEVLLLAADLGGRLGLLGDVEHEALDVASGVPSSSRTIQLSSRTQTVLPSAWMIRYSYVDFWVVPRGWCRRR